MIKNERNYHQRLQEFCDCFMETDPKRSWRRPAKESPGTPRVTWMNRPLNSSALEYFLAPVRRARRSPSSDREMARFCLPLRPGDSAIPGFAGIGIPKSNMSCQYTPNLINYDVRNKSIPEFVRLLPVEYRLEANAQGPGE